MKLSRRNTFKLAAAIGASSLVPVREARAVPLPVVLSVASAGFELYKLSRGGGGGVAKLLSMQVQMLRAISAQLTAIGTVVTQIYAGVNELKELVAKVPSATSVQIARDKIRNTVENGAGLLRDIDVRSVQYGNDAARAFYSAQTMKTIGDIREDVGTIARDDSVANIPLLCLTWYCELQMMLVSEELDLSQLRRRSDDYARVLDPWVRQTSEIIQALAQEATSISSEVIKAEPLDGMACNTGWSERISYGDSYGHDGNLTRERADTRYEAHLLDATPEPATEELLQFLQQWSDLRGAGVEIAPEIENLRVPSWTDTKNSVAWSSGWVGDSRAGPLIPPRRALFNAAVCRAPVNPPAPFIDRQNGFRSPADALRLKAVVHYHFLLAGREALASMKAIGERAAA